MDKSYLMIGGTFLPAFLAVGIAMSIEKRAKVKMSDLLLFAGFSAAGGFLTAKLLKNNRIIE